MQIHMIRNSILIGIILLSSPVLAGVIVSDDVVHVNHTVRIKVLTKGTFSPEGGRLVKLVIDDTDIGTTLSGGDGYAFFSFVPQEGGIRRIKASSGEESGEGVLLVTEKKDRVLLIAADGILLPSLVVKEDDAAMQEVLSALGKSFRLIYLVRMIGSSQAHVLIDKKGLPDSVVIPWEGESTVEDLRTKELPLYAIVGPPDILSQAGGIEKRFSFDETEDGTEVSDWNELRKLLQKHEQGK